jgi:hypothetical protein
MRTFTLTTAVALSLAVTVTSLAVPVSTQLNGETSDVAGDYWLVMGYANETCHGFGVGHAGRDPTGCTAVAVLDGTPILSLTVKPANYVVTLFEDESCRGANKTFPAGTNQTCLADPTPGYSSFLVETASS